MISRGLHRKSDPAHCNMVALASIAFVEVFSKLAFRCAASSLSELVCCSTTSQRRLPSSRTAAKQQVSNRSCHIVLQVKNLRNLLQWRHEVAGLSMMLMVCMVHIEHLWVIDPEVNELQ